MVVPSYRRPDQLAECLLGISRQERAPDEVIVVRRAEDQPTAAELDRSPVPVTGVVVSEPGQVAALCAGVKAASGEIVAIVDDDAVPRPDWLARLAPHFDDAAVGGVGGRDVVHEGGGILTGEKEQVGKLTRWGRSIGNHHLGVGPPRDVDILKGCNCAYRRDVVGFPLSLRGQGAQVANDLATSLYVRAKGLRLVYDPSVVIDHYPGQRFDEDSRGAQSRQAKLDGVYNFAYAICSVRPDVRRRYLFYHVAVGNRMAPGAVRGLAGKLRRETGRTGQLVAGQRTIWQATRDARRRPLRFWEP